MISTVVSAIVTPGKKIVNGNPVIYFRTAHKVAIGADVIVGAALLVIGICGTQWGFMPVSSQYAMIGIGSTYLTLKFAQIVGLIKLQKAPSSYLIK